MRIIVDEKPDDCRSCIIAELCYYCDYNGTRENTKDCLLVTLDELNKENEGNTYE